MHVTFRPVSLPLRISISGFILSSEMISKPAGVISPSVSATPSGLGVKHIASFTLDAKPTNRKIPSIASKNFIIRHNSAQAFKFADYKHGPLL